jgi:molybdenum cofactor guanylyltransferase
MRPPVGVVLAGGAGRRIGGDKATVELAGRPLLYYALDALSGVVADVAVAVKSDTALPPLPSGTGVWVEPDEPSHPLSGIVHALRFAEGRPVLVCAVDQPLVTAGTLRELLAERPAGAHAVVAHADGRLQPLCALYLPRALADLEDFPPDARATDVVAALNPRLAEFEDRDLFLNINTPEDLLYAAGLLDRRRRARA